MNRTMRLGSWMLAAILGVVWSAAAESKDKVPDNWPTNPYWTTSAPPNGPGHKLGKYDELLKTVPKERIGIKVNRFADMGTFAVSDVLKFNVCGGDKEGRLAINNKGQDSHALNKATLEWRDETGEKVLETKAIEGECG